MIPAIYNFPDAYRGDTYGPISFTFNDVSGSGIPLDGMTAACQVRNKKSRAIVVQWLSENSGISISGSQLILNPIGGSGMRIPPNIYDCDLQLNNSGVIKTYISGELQVYQDITEL